MKKRLTRGEKWLFAAPLLLLIVAGSVWQWKKTTPIALDFPVSLIGDSLVFSPDGKRLLVSSTQTRTLHEIYSVYDLESRSKICDLNEPSGFSAKRPNTHPDCGGVSWSSDGSSLVSCCNNVSSPQVRNKILIWDASTGVVKTDLLYTSANPNPINENIYFSPDDKKLLGDGIPPAVYDAATGEILKWPDSNLSKKDLAEFNEKLGLVAVEDMNTRFRVIDFATKRTVWKPSDRFIGDTYWYGDILGIDTQFLDEVHQGESCLLLWDGKTRKTLKSPPISANQNLEEFTFSPDHSTLVYYCPVLQRTLDAPPKSSNEIAVWDYRKNRLLWLTKTDEKLSNFVWSPDGKWLSAMCEYPNESGAPPDLEVGVRNDQLYSILVFDNRGKLCFKRDTYSYLSAWSPDSKQLAIVADERDKARNVLINRVEIVRIADLKPL